MTVSRAWSTPSASSVSGCVRGQHDRQRRVPRVRRGQGSRFSLVASLVALVGFMVGAVVGGHLARRGAAAAHLLATAAFVETVLVAAALVVVGSSGCRALAPRRPWPASWHWPWSPECRGPPPRGPRPHDDVLTMALTASPADPRSRPRGRRRLGGPPCSWCRGRAALVTHGQAWVALGVATGALLAVSVLAVRMSTRSPTPPDPVWRSRRTEGGPTRSVPTRRERRTGDVEDRIPGPRIDGNPDGARLIEAGNDVTVWNRTVERTVPLPGSAPRWLPHPLRPSVAASSWSPCWPRPTRSKRPVRGRGPRHRGGTGAGLDRHVDHRAR